MARWSYEAVGRKKDDEGRWIVHQITASSMISNNIYCEQPYSSPDGQRVAVVRSPDWTLNDGNALLVVDLPSLRITLIEPLGGCLGVCTSAWREWLHYWTRDERRAVLKRVSLLTFEKQDLYECAADDERVGAFGSVSPDFRYMVGPTRLGPQMYGIARLDIQRGDWEVIHEDPEITNPHVQYNPVTGKDLLIQWNRGSEQDAEGNWIRNVGPLGTSLYLIDADGGNRRPLPVGEPWTCGATGHECFIADTGRVLFSTTDNTEKHPEYAGVTLFIADPNEDKPIPIPADGHIINHVSVSKCGRFFVCDSYRDGPPGPVPLLVGSIKTGRYRELVESQASCGGPQFTHPHPYFTADNRHVIYNADPYGSPQVYEATVPDGFLESLDS